MEGLATLLERAHPVDREVLPLWAHPAFRDRARRALYGFRYWSRVKAAVLSTASLDLDFVDRAIAWQSRAL